MGLFQHPDLIGRHDAFCAGSGEHDGMVESVGGGAHDAHFIASATWPEQGRVASNGAKGRSR